MQSNNRWFSLAAITPTRRIWLSLLLIATSLLVLVFRPFPETRARYIISRASHMPLVSAASLQVANPGSEILLEGRIGEGSQPQFRSFVAYVRETFIFKQGWSVQDRITPPLRITVPDGELRVINTDYSLLQRTLPTEWRPDFQRFSASEQYRGLVLGSRVALFGTVEQDETGHAIRAEYVAGGSQADLLTDITQEIGTDDTNLTVGDGGLLIGGWVLLISLFQVISSTRTKRGLT